MCDSRRRGGLVASLQAAMFAEGDIKALVNGRLVCVVIVGQQRLLELALVTEDPLKMVRMRWLVIGRSPVPSRHLSITPHTTPLLSQPN